MATEEELKSVLQQYWGFQAFRAHQREVIETVIYGRDCLLLMATGRGKSLCYQFPSLLLRDKKGYRCVTVVVSPLLALIEDQVAGLRANGISALAVGSAATNDEVEGALLGDYALLYVTPERLEGWLDSLVTLHNNVGLAALAIDEAHCVSQWGHDFRPAYLLLYKLREQLPDVPIIAVSATATHHVQEDIIQQLRLDDPLVIRSGINRPNLHYTVKSKSPGGPMEDLGGILRGSAGSAIVYVLTKAEAEELATALTNKLSISASAYHGGLSATVRQQVYNQWSRDEVRVVCATVAFGMGVDKPDVRTVVCFGLTKSLEDFLQMTGRAGRDGLPSRCVMYWGTKDVGILNFLATHTNGSEQPEGRSSEEQTASNMAKVQEVQKFARHAGCRRESLLRHFGEMTSAAALQAAAGTDRCCDYCDLNVEMDAATVMEPGRVVRGSLPKEEYQNAARHVLGAVEKMRAGSKKVLLMLAASEQKDIRTRPDIDRIKGHPAWGAAKKSKQGEAWWKAWLNQLMDEGYVEYRQLQGAHGVIQILELTAKGRLFLGDPSATLAPMVASQGLVEAEGQLRVQQQRLEAREEARRQREEERMAARVKEENVLQALMQVRAQQARNAPDGTKAYQISDESFLRQLALVRPTTVEKLREVGGWPETKIQRYGQAFLDVIQKKSKELGLTTDCLLLTSALSGAADVRVGEAVPADKTAATGVLRPSYLEAHHLYMEQGKSIREIANNRPKPIQEGTVRNYLAQCFLHGLPLDWSRIAFPPGLLDAVVQAMATLQSTKTKTHDAMKSPPAAIETPTAARLVSLPNDTPPCGGRGGSSKPFDIYMTRDIKIAVPEFWQGKEASWGDVETCRIFLTCQQNTTHARQAHIRPPSLAPDSSQSLVGSAGDGEWMTTRKRPASLAMDNTLQGRRTNSKGSQDSKTDSALPHGSDTKKPYQPSYLQNDSAREICRSLMDIGGGSCEDGVSADSNAAQGKRLNDTSRLYSAVDSWTQRQTPISVDSTPGALKPSISPARGHVQTKAETAKMTPKKQDASAQVTATSIRVPEQKLLPSTAEVIKLLTARPNGLTVSEMLAHLDLAHNTAQKNMLRGCVRQLQNECVVYMVGERFRLL